MFELSSYRTDADKALNGVWVDFIDGARIKVAAIDNPKYQQRLMQAKKDGKLDMNDDELPTAQQWAQIYNLYVGTVLLDWEGFTENNKPAKFSKERAIEALINVKPLQHAVTSAASNEALYRQKQAADIEKN